MTHRTARLPPGGTVATLSRGLVLWVVCTPIYIYAQNATPSMSAAQPLSQAEARLLELCGPEARHHSLEQLLAHISPCQNQPDWLAHLGERLNAQGKYAEAAEHLERALLLAPQHLGAAFAYAIALAGTGDTVSAVQLLAQTSTSPDLPESQRQQLQLAQQRMAGVQHLPTLGALGHGWHARPSVALRMGHDNNLLGAPRLGSLTLTLPGGDITLPLESNSQPQPGAYQRADLRLDATHLHDNGRRTDLALALQHRQTPALSAATTTQAEALAETQPTGAGPWSSASLANLHTQGGTRYHSTGLAAGWAWATPGCQPRLGAEWQDRQLSSNPVLSGRYTGFTLSWACNQAPALVSTSWEPQQWSIHLRAGQDNPTQTTRPGGAQRIAALRATARWPLWVAEAELAHTQDSTGYSPLLANNRVRHSTRGLLRLERQQPLHTWSPGLQAHWGIEVYSQHANLALFKVHSTSVYASLRKQW